MKLGDESGMREFIEACKGFCKLIWRVITFPFKLARRFITSLLRVWRCIKLSYPITTYSDSGFKSRVEKANEYLKSLGEDEIQTEGGAKNPELKKSLHAYQEEYVKQAAEGHRYIWTVIVFFVSVLAICLSSGIDVALSVIIALVVTFFFGFFYAGYFFLPGVMEPCLVQAIISAVWEYRENEGNQRSLKEGRRIS